MRISSLALLLVLASCGEKPVGTVPAEQTGEEDRIPCGRAGGALARTCTVDREQRDDGLVLTLRRPDGGFRRLLVTRDGRGVVAADGAEPARVAVVDADRIDVMIGDDRFRLPATVRARP